jgi:hypothetical protein
MKKFIYLLLLMFAIAVVTKCGSDNSTKAVSESMQTNKAAEYVTMTHEERKAKILECAGCHKKEYDNEMIGPHANAYKSLMTHKEEHEQNPKEYMNFIHSNMNKECVKCHATENLYQTVFAGLEHEKDVNKFNAAHFPEMFKIPQPRADTLSWITGIDCLTCHSVGNAVVGSFHENNENKKAACKPIASAFFTGNTNCYSCHFSINNSMSDNIHNQQITAKMNCNSCHIETDENGAKTHYFFWRHDSPEKQKHALLKKAFENFVITRNPDDNENFTVTWQNQSSPHGLAQCTELLVICRFVGNNKKIIATHKIRANSKPTIDKDLAPQLGFQEMPGETGYSFLPNEKAFMKQLKVKNGGNVKEIILEYYEKPQFWIADELAMKVDEKKILL